MLSVVAASRNDGHGLYLLERTQVFIDGLADQVNRLHRPVELILVDWNPPSNAAPLRNVLKFPDAPGFALRFISVPAAEHARLSGANQLDFYQMIAKNVGIRRATGDAVLATNIDILLSDALFLASTEPIADRCVYRADRLDIRFDPNDEPTLNDLRQARPIRLNRKDGIYYPGTGRGYPHVRGARDMAATFLSNPIALTRQLASWSSSAGPPSLRRYRRAFVQALTLPRLHLNACGDFTLMSQASWRALRGYPEWEMFSWNLDSLLLYQAAAAGFRFVDLEHPAIHLEHSEGWSPEAQFELFERMEARGVAVLSNVALLDVAGLLWRRRNRALWMTNTANWGLAHRELSEVRLSAA